MQKYLKIDPAKDAVIGEVFLPSDAIVNTREAANINGKPYLLPVTTETAQPYDAETEKPGTPEYTLSDKSAVVLIPKVPLSEEEVAAVKSSNALRLLSRTDADMARVTEEIYALVRQIAVKLGLQIDVSPEAKALIDSRETARESV